MPIGQYQSNETKCSKSIELQQSIDSKSSVEKKPLFRVGCIPLLDSSINWFKIKYI